MSRYWLAKDSKSGYYAWVEDDGISAYRVLNSLGQTSEIKREITVGIALEQLFYPMAFEQCTLKPGEYHPRICRPLYSTDAHDAYLRERLSSVQAVRNLLAELRRIFRTIEPSPKNASAYSHELRQLLILSCTEVESSFKSILRCNEYPGTPRNWTMRQYFKLRRPMRLGEWEVKLRYYPDYGLFKPFADWEPNKGLSWYRAYNAVKHDRESALEEATLHNAISSTAAAFIAVLAQFGTFGAESGQAEDNMFDIVTHPEWAPSEHYIPPELQPGATWTAVPLSF